MADPEEKKERLKSLLEKYSKDDDFGLDDFGDDLDGDLEDDLDELDLNNDAGSDDFGSSNDDDQWLGYKIKKIFIVYFFCLIAFHQKKEDKEYKTGFYVVSRVQQQKDIFV